MQIVQNFATPGHGLSMHDSRRRHDLVTRKALYAREAAMREATLSPKDKGKVANAARALVNAYQMQRVSRQQIEEEQRADEVRLKGWQAAPPQPGTPFAEEPTAIRYRMAVRAKALDEIASLELAVMISSTDRNRSKDTTSVPPAKPWRAGTGHGSNSAKRGKPIGLREYNHCHDPQDGRFCSGGGGGGASRREETPAYGLGNRGPTPKAVADQLPFGPGNRNPTPASVADRLPFGPGNRRSTPGDERGYGYRRSYADDEYASEETHSYGSSARQAAANAAAGAAAGAVPGARSPQTPVKLVTPRKGSVADMARQQAQPQSDPPYHEPGREAEFKPKAKLRGLLPDLGFTLSTDFSQTYNALYRRVQRRTKYAPTARQMDAMVDEWAGYMRTLQASPGRPGTHAEMNAVVTRALAKAAKQKKSDEYA